MRRYFLATTAAVMMTLSLVHPVASSATASAPPQPAPAPAQTEADAVQQAKQTGRSVEIAEQTTQTKQVLANPNGSFTLKSNRRAVRVKKDGVWTPVDTTLRANPDGSLVPVATDQNVTFSGGGSAPLVTIRHDDRALAFSWPTPLPRPTVAGDTATYPAVLPGVDLQLRATADSYSQVLVVHNAEAAANPALQHISYTATGTGLNLTIKPDGTVSATDPAGTEVLHGPAPRMWDSNHDDPGAPVPTATDSGSSRVSDVAITGARRSDATLAAATDLVLTPDPAALTGPAVVYPVYIDPGMSSRKLHWTEVTDRFGPYYDADKEARVGFCSGWAECGSPAWKARSYFQLDISPLWYRNNQKPTIWRAQFFVYQVWSADHNCAGSQPTAVYESGGIDSGTNWPGPAVRYLDTQGSNAGGPCPAANLVFNVGAAANNASDGHWASLVLGLEAGDETDRYQWKRFNNNPLLEVDYTFPPNNANGLRLSNEVKCTGTAVTPDSHPTLLATATDNNSPPLQPTFWHHVWTADDSRTISASSGIRIVSGATGAWTVPDRLSDGNWKFRIYTDHYPDDTLSNSDNGGFSVWYPFTVRATPPAQAPQIVNAFDYPENYWGAPQGAPGAIGVNANGAANIVGYTYSFLGSGTEVVPNTNDCAYNRAFGTTGGWIAHHSLGTNWIPIPAGLSPGRHTMHVRSFDDAHNLSPETTYTFYVAANTGLSKQRLEAENLTRSQPAGQNVPLGPSPDCCNNTWSGGAFLNLQGNAIGQSFTASFQTTVESDYNVAVGLVKANDTGQLAFRLDGQPIGQQTPAQPIGSIDTYAKPAIGGHQPLGIRHLTAGTHTLSVTVTGTNPGTNGLRYAAGIDYLDLTQTTRLEAEDSAQVTWTVPDEQTIQPAPQTLCSCWGIAWSNGSQLLFSSNVKNTSFDLTFRVPVEADYALGANLTKANDYGKLSFSLDGKPLLGTDTTPWDGYNPTLTSGYKALGGAHLAAGAHKLTIKVVDTNPASVNARYLAGVDYLSIVPVNNVLAADFTAAMNNDGISSDSTTGTVNLPVTLPRAIWTVTADSEQSNETPVRNAFDGNTGTFWHTQYAPTTPPLPHTVTIDMHASNIVAGLRYQPRIDHPNGTIGGFQIHISTDGTNWGAPVTTGSFPDNTIEKTVSFAPVTARFVRLTAVTEAGSRGPWSSAAEINLTGLVPVLPRAPWTVAADSEQANETPARYAIDGDPNTKWHTQYAPTTPPLPHTFTIDMHASNIVAGLRYQPRIDHPNGTIGGYQIHTSTDGTNWGSPVATGTFIDNTADKVVPFAPTTARFVRLTALTEAGNRGPWSSAAEINLIPGGVDGFDLGGSVLSAQALAAAGYAPGATATINGATFTMPAARADGSDNVIAIGQTIPFPAAQQVKASAVGLLVAATCGATPDKPGAITYTDSTTQQTPFAKVEDWIGMPTDLASFVLPYRNDDGTTNSAARPRLLALFVPADPTKTLRSITLPNYGTSLLPGSCSPALHVLAIAPRPLATGWIGTWAAPVDTAKPAPGSGLADKTVRSVIHPTVTGSSVRVRLTNPTDVPVTIDAASLAAQAGTNADALAAPVALKFGGSNGITLPAAGEAMSDPIAYPATSGGSGNLLVSVHIPTAVAYAPIHASPSSPTYLASGNATAGSAGTPFTTVLGGFRYISGVEVSTSDASKGTVAVLGDQLTAVAPPGSGYRPTWVDALPAKLATGGVPLPGGLVNTSLAGLPPLAAWRLDDGSGTTARDSAAGTVGHPATLSGGASWSTERGGAVSLNGTGSLATSGSVIATDISGYTVSAWVKLNATSSAAQTIASQDGSQSSTFALRYNGSATNKWAFTMYTSSGATAAQVLSNNPVQTGTWTHVLGVYNTASRTAELYVNGQFQGWASNPAPVSAAGPFAMGRGKTNGNPAAFLNGVISDVRVYDRAATGWDAKILSTGGPGTGPQPGVGAATVTDANRTLDRTVLNQPQVRTVIVALGANDILAGGDLMSIKREFLELTAELPTSATGVTNSRRSDGSPVHVILTTVPAIGLAETDPRERVRQDLNADMLTNRADYGADEVVDLANAVRDPAHINQINPAFLSGGAPNNAYHDAIAQAISDAATRFPPEAQL